MATAASLIAWLEKYPADTPVEIYVPEHAAHHRRTINSLVAEQDKNGLTAPLVISAAFYGVAGTRSESN